MLHGGRPYGVVLLSCEGFEFVKLDYAASGGEDGFKRRGWLVVGLRRVLLGTGTVVAHGCGFRCGCS